MMRPLLIGIGLSFSAVIAFGMKPKAGPRFFTFEKDHIERSSTSEMSVANNRVRRGSDPLIIIEATYKQKNRPPNNQGQSKKEEMSKVRESQK